MTTAATDRDAVAALMTPEAVRSRCDEVYRAGIEDSLAWFRVDLGKLPLATERVVAEIDANYPSRDIPFHSRWRHFELGGEDLWARAADAGELVGVERGIAAGDLAVISVLLDAGAGPDWVFTDPMTGQRLGRSEGLALASLRLFESGALSAEKSLPLRVDAEMLKTFAAGRIADAFQVDGGNPLIGVEQRAGLLRRLGAALENHPEFFARDGAIRPGNLIPALAERSSLCARDILIALLRTLAEIWPSPVRIDGRPLGDVGRHPAVSRTDETNGIVPFHKLSQWLSYSLIEPLREMGAEVSALDDLTGLAEYRNGGLFVDTGVLALKDPDAASRANDPQSELVVEWRALTVALLDRVASEVRTALGRSEDDLPLASILQGGTWAAGRTVAAERRPGGGPPIRIVSDATVF